MERIILIKYGELTTKKKNRKFFINKLYENVKHKLAGYECLIKRELSFMTIEFKDKDLQQIKEIINNIFGIQMYHIAYIVDTNIDSITLKTIAVMKEKKFKTFKVETKRANKNFPIHSLEISKKLGGDILKNITDISVDVHNPEVLIKLEIRDNYTYIYTDTFKGSCGYPVGVQGKGLLMLSGGIDSVIAGYLAMKRGIKLEAVYFEALPHTSMQAREKVIDLVKKLTNYTDSINLKIVNFTPIQEAIYKNCNKDYTITIMRRMMYSIMEKLVIKDKGYVIINGESIGQVASQTLSSMKVINNVTNIPVIRPLSCFDKLEIIDIAKKIDTYDISILPYEDCCTVFVPKHPVINPRLDTCLKEETKFGYLDLIDDAVNNILTIKVTDSKDNTFKDLL